MAKVEMTTTLGAPASTVWDAIGGFGAIAAWHPAIEKCEESVEDGARIRRLTLAGGGGTLVERLEAHDDGGRNYSYSIQGGPVPLTGYLSRISVREGPGGEGCEVAWRGEFEPDGVPESQAMEIVEGVYRAGFDGLRKMFGG